MGTLSSPDEVTIQISTDGRIAEDAPQHAREVIGRLLHLGGRPVTSARVRLTRHGDPAVRRPVIAQGNLEVGGRRVRAQADGPTAAEAIDRLSDRLRRRLERVAEGWEARRGRRPSEEPHEWRHDSPPRRPEAWFPRPEEEREIVRRKSFTPHVCSVDDAARDMGLLDLDFHLFTEQGSGRDTVIYRSGDTGFRLAQTTPPAPHDLAPFELPVTVSSQPAPELTPAAAVERMNLLGLPFLFFLDLERGRGAVIYRRFDGHYGLIAPAG
ncbi:sigma 54 modulation/S30EA ribosomal C-terminal domain-containing protein [Actinomycetospora cinnamomea]|uniref:Sigma 54 modulation/S30EA-like ribosomal protein n=1 Tax=Actinomycetospora cinnamomea TaxID=663609 RepID=A0A2U1F0X0_9PSEU|nr:sigma 54 modulation/S30EA ribosomal C-terminal domain-containing protein [Actinomycetospora cinnamomea]PVZ05834.1 sigma 54 modulation/S30EA-like ribosomal protein [Actinomycetospora cinnamomea]